MREKMIALLCVLLLISGNAQALTVFDPRNYQANSQTLAQQVTAVAHAYTQIQNQLQQLQNEAKNLENMDAATANETISHIQDNLNQLYQLQQQMQSVLTDYENLESVWDSVYTDYADADGLTGEDYVQQAAKVVDTTNQAIYDAMYMQGFGVSGVNDVVGNLGHLLEATNSASGALAAAQAGNQIAALQAQQMMLLQQMIAKNNQAQLAYQKQQMAQDLAAEQAAATAYTHEVTPQANSGPGIIR